MVLRLIQITILTLFIANSVFAQQRRMQFQHLTVEQGLSSSTIHTIVQDKNDFIWIGTEDGLNKFDGYNFSVYRHDILDKHSISGNSVHTIYEDTEGLLWLGVFDGSLSCFNPKTHTFTNYLPREHHTDSLNHIDVNTITEDRFGRIWLGTSGGGINIFDKKSKRFLKYNSEKPESAPTIDNYIFSFTKDKDGSIWAITKSNSIYEIDPVTLQANEYFLPVQLMQQRKQQKKKKIFIDSKNNLWVGSKKGLYTFNKTTKRFTRVCDSQKQICSATIMQISEEEGKGLWICTDGKGLYFYDFQSKHFHHYEHLALPKHLSSNAVYSLLIDRDKNIWVGTFNGGLNFHANNSNKFQLYQYHKGNKSSLSNSSVLSFCDFDDNYVVIGTDGGGLNLFNVKSGTFYNDYPLIEKINSSFNGIAKSLFRDSENRLWVGTYADGLLRVDLASGQIKHFKHNKRDTNSLADNNVWTIYEDKNKDIWIGMLWGGLDKYIPETESFEHHQNDPYNNESLPANLVFDIEEADSSLWLATISGGLVRFNEKENIAIPYKHNSSNKNSICSNDLICIYVDHKKNIWAGTKRGLSSYSTSSKLFSNYSTEDGLPSNFITGISEDRMGNLWITTLNGLTQFSPAKNAFKNFNVNDGLQSNEFNKNSIFKNKDGLIFLGGINGFNIVNIDSINFNYRAPKVVISEFRVFNTPVILEEDPTKKHDFLVTLNHTSNYVSFEFTALDYAAPEKNKYAYMLEGFDSDFQYTNADKRYITYTNLDPGEYILHVKGSNSDDIWNNEGVKVKLVISPPFWKTNMFILGLVLLLIFITQAFIRSRSKRLQKANQELANKVRLRTVEIEQQKEEIMTQRDEIVAQRDNIKQQRDEMLEQQQDIMASIMYAKRLQSALLPPDKAITNFFDEYFILFKPKDIVSGDFYWLGTKDQKIILVAADCTGHGVPGAFMSVLGISYLTDMVSKLSDTFHASDILERLNSYVVEALHQTDRFMSNKDGMDISLCVYDPETLELQFAGANNSVIIIRNHEAIVLKADRMPIGYSYSERKEFNNHSLQLEKGDMLYMFSDGYPDQFGGPKGKKYFTKRLKQLFIDISAFSMRDQKKILNMTFKEWMGDEEQVDDVIIWGTRI